MWIRKTFYSALMGMVATIALVGSDNALAFIWNFTCSGGTTCSSTDGGNGNKRAFTSGGEMITAQAFSTATDNGTGNLQVDPSVMILLGFGLIALRIVVSKHLNKRNDAFGSDPLKVFARVEVET
jgi:hypothetical protein